MSATSCQRCGVPATPCACPVLNHHARLDKFARRLRRLERLGYLPAFVRAFGDIVHADRHTGALLRRHHLHVVPGGAR